MVFNIFKLELIKPNYFSIACMMLGFVLFIYFSLWKSKTFVVALRRYFYEDDKYIYPVIFLIEHFLLCRAKPLASGNSMTSITWKCLCLCFCLVKFTKSTGRLRRAQ